MSGTQKKVILQLEDGSTASNVFAVDTSTGKLFVDMDVISNGNMTCGHDLHITGDSVSNRVFTSGDMTCGHDLHITGDSVSNRVFTSGDMTCNGNHSVRGDVILLGADCAEEFDMSSDNVEPGTVMVLNNSGNVQESYQSYDKKVAGIVSGAGNYKPGLILDKKVESNNKRIPIALIGKVYCKVDATHSPIEIGDLLTTSPMKGHAMKAEDPYKAFGSVIGKALGSIKEGLGMIPVLVALQ